MDSKLQGGVPQTYEAAPPAYGSVDDYNYDDSSSDSSDDDFEDYAAPSGGIPLPCVIPQITKIWKGAFFSPFVRAYVPELEAHNITQSDFLTFIDGLNESFVASPVFQGLGIVGRVMTMAYGVHAVQLAGLGLDWGSGAASAAMSYTRTRMYVKAMNKDLFHPAGLNMTILTTKKILGKVGYANEKLQLPPLDWSNDLENAGGLKSKETAGDTSQALDQNDPRMRRLQALQGYVMPLDLNVPGATVPDNLFKKMGAAQAKRMEAKQNRKLTKQRTKGERRYMKTSRKAERRQSKGDSRLENLERELESNKAVLDQQMAATQDPKQQQALMKEHHKREDKLQRKISKRAAKTERRVGKSSSKAQKRHDKLDKKEHKTAHKIRWIVISQWGGPDESSDDSLSASDSEVEDASVEEAEKWKQQQ